MSTPETAYTEPPREKFPESARLNRARRVLGWYYLLLPFVLVYFLFKVFPPYPWPTENAILINVPIYLLQGRIPILTSLEERLLLLVIVAGALGSYIHSATSYSDYRGNRQFNPSWLLWYLVRPLVGVCLALVIYFAVRGGLLLLVVNGSGATEAKNINPFGVAAISGLTGMFSKQAADKLAEVFTTLFKSQGDAYRKDSLTPAAAPVIKIVDPDKGSVAGGDKVTITGTGFATGAKVFVGGELGENVEVVNDRTITFETPAGVAGKTDIDVENEDGQKATSLKGYTYIALSDDTVGDKAAAGNAGSSDEAGVTERAGPPPVE